MTDVGMLEKKFNNAFKVATLKREILDNLRMLCTEKFHPSINKTVGYFSAKNSAYSMVPICNWHILFCHLYYYLILLLYCLFL